MERAAPIICTVVVPVAGHEAFVYEGQTSHERVAVLLQFLGGWHRTELPANAIEPKEAVS